MMYPQSQPRPIDARGQQRRRGSGPRNSLKCTTPTYSDESLLARSLGNPASDMASLHRHSSETFCISHSGYLLKRSNRPFRSVSPPTQVNGGSDQTINVGVAPGPTTSIAVPLPRNRTEVSTTCSGNDQVMKESRTQISIGPQHQQSSDQQPTLGPTTARPVCSQLHPGTTVPPLIDSKVSSPLDDAISLAAAFFGYDSGEDISSYSDLNDRCEDENDDQSPGLGEDANLSARVALLTQNQVNLGQVLTTQSEARTKPIALAERKMDRLSFPSPINPASPGPAVNFMNEQNFSSISMQASYLRYDSAPAVLAPASEPSELADISSHSTSKPPADFVDPTDGHIWRAKYCVLEDGVLYFYHSASIGDSKEAQMEREQMSLFQSSPNASQSSGLYDGSQDDIAKSPMARQHHPMLAAKQRGNAGSFCHDSCVIWEKRVALDCVGAVRSAEIEYGACSFELLATEYEDNPNQLDDSIRGGVGSPVAGQPQDAGRLILRAGSTEEMTEWLFQFHRSLASFMKEIVKSVGYGVDGAMFPAGVLRVGDLHHPVDPYYAYGTAMPTPVGVGPVQIMGGIAPTATLPSTGIGSSYNPGGIHFGSVGHVDAVDSRSLSHGHGRNGMHRRRVRANHKVPDQQPHPESSSLASTPDGGASPVLAQAMWELSDGVDGVHLASTGKETKSTQSDFERTMLKFKGEQEKYVPTENVRLVSSSISSSTTASAFDAGIGSAALSRNSKVGTTSIPSPPRPLRKGMKTDPAEQNQSTNNLKASSPVPLQVASASTSPDTGHLPPKPAIKSGKYIPPHLRKKKDAGVSSKPMSSGKYIPPHLRNRGGKNEEKTHLNPPSDSCLSPGAPPAKPPVHVSDESSERKVAVPLENQDVACSLEEKESGAKPNKGSDSHLGGHLPSFVKLGGCADPSVAIGSILDPLYKSRSASKIGKVYTKAYGSFGGFDDTTCTDHNSIGEQKIDDEEKESKEADGHKTCLGENQKNSMIKWEVGAVSECGVRDSNEDSYLITNDLIASLSTLRSSSNKTKNDGSGKKESKLRSSICPSIQQQGLFAIFDGHCGNQAARYAAEKLPNFLLDEVIQSRGSEPTSQCGSPDWTRKILLNAVARLDESFCNLCTLDGRDWECGATALVTLLSNDMLVVANLGDCRGVMCGHTSSALLEEHGLTGDSMQHPLHEADGWSRLELDDEETDRSKWVRATGDGAIFDDCDDVHCYWKEITDTHCPSREDERSRIEAANGWITTEQEIPIGQLKRMDLCDEDVVEILKRCFSDRYSEHSSAQSHLSSKQCSAAPGRLLKISRVCGELAVSRALGDRDFKAAFNVSSSEEALDSELSDDTNSSISWDGPLFLPYADDHNRRFQGDLISASPEVQVLRVGRKGVADEFLLLACDGLWDVMDADDAIRVTRSLLFVKCWSAKKAAARLAELAIHLGSSDNITVILIRFFEDKK